MSKAFTRESDSDPDDDRDDDGGDALPASAKNYVTPAGHAAQQDELWQLWQEERPKVVEVVSWAASNGDRSENADYQYGKKPCARSTGGADPEISDEVVGDHGIDGAKEIREITTEHKRNEYENDRAPTGHATAPVNICHLTREARVRAQLRHSRSSNLVLCLAGNLDEGLGAGSAKTHPAFSWLCPG